jgi:PAS domain S-box-containing protein
VTSAGHGHRISSGLLEAAPDAILAVDASGRIVLINAQAERLFGYAREELVGRSVDILVPDAVRRVHAAHRARYLTDPRPRPMGASLELAARRKDGTEFPAEISLSGLRTDGEIIVAAAVRDVTERRQSAEAQHLLATIVNSSHDAIVGKTLDGVITSWNTAATRLYGYPPEETVGHRADMLIPAELRAEEADFLRRTASGQRVEQYQTRRLRKDGTEITVSLTMSPIADSAGEIVGVASVARDISDLQRAEAKFRGLLEAAPDGIVGVDLTGRIALINAQAERLFGYRRSELLGQPMEALVPHGLRELHVRHRGRYLADPRPRPMGAGMLLAARRKDGTEFPVEISLSTLATEDGLLASASIRDITERVDAQAERERLLAVAERERLESRLHQSQRLESLGQLAGGVAHDFNNLLGVILNYASFVEEEVANAAAQPAAAQPAAAQPAGAEPWPGVRRDVEQIRRAAERATELTHQLLAFGRREVVRPRVLNLNHVVAEVEQLLHRTLGEHVQLKTSLAGGLWPVLADPGQLEQVLVNLAINARDAMPGGGTLTVRTANVVIDEDYASVRPGLKTGRHVQLQVTDTGAGMPRHVVERVFEPFFTTKPKGEGTGLGLATVYGIITQAEGHVQFYSEPGHGTTFTALLPATDQLPVETEPAAPSSRPTNGGETVLVVEDEAALREVTDRILARNGYRVITARHGAEAIDVARHEAGEIHLLITDVIMPEMLGREVAANIRASRPGVRVLYMSGYAHPVLTSQGTLEAGVTLIEKPFTEADLLAKVREVLEPG